MTSLEAPWSGAAAAAAFQRARYVEQKFGGWEWRTDFGLSSPRISRISSNEAAGLFLE